MLQKVEILEPGDTGLIRGDHLDKTELDEENAKAEARGGRPAIVQPVLLGITKASLQTRSFDLAASVPGDDAGVLDRRLGARQGRHPGRAQGERLAVGWLIPAGTGSYLRGLQRIAAKRDEQLAQQREQTMEALPEEIAVQAEEEASV